MGERAGTTAAAYLRVSSAAQAGEDRFGYERQRDDIAKYAAANGLVIAEEYRDAITGTGVTREALQELKEKASKYDAVIISSVDRLARSVSASYAALADLLELGLAVHTADVGLVNLEDELTLVQFNMRALFSHLERNKILERTKAAKVAMAKRGLMPIGITTYGYKSEDGKAVIVPEKAAIVRRIFKEVSEGKSLRAIAHDINVDGVPPPRPYRAKGEPRWRWTTVRALAMNKAYKGEYQWSSNGRTFVIPVPQIVSPTEWAQGQPRTVGPRPRSGWPLVGHLRCGTCGRRMNARTDYGRNKKYESYRCQSHALYEGSCGHPTLRRLPLEERAEALLRERLADPETVKRWLQQVDDTGPELEAQLAELEEEDARWLDAFKSRVITAVELGNYRRELRAREAELRSQQPVTYSVDDYVAEAADSPFGELLDELGVVFIAKVDGSLDVTVE